MPDPKAPASSPRHPSQTRQNAGVDTTHEDLARLAEEEVRLLSDTHITDAERDALAVGDLTDQPSLDELRVRRDALVDYLTARDSEPETARPEIVDLTGAEHVLEVSEDGAEAKWSLVPQEADSGQQGDENTTADADAATEQAPAEETVTEQAPDLDAALAALDKAKPAATRAKDKRK